MLQPEEKIIKSETFINVRKLAALDIVFHGSRLILVEFALGMVLCAILGLWSLSFLSPIHSPFMIVIGSYLLGVAFNYLPLLLYAISIVAKRGARTFAACLKHSQRIVVPGVGHVWNLQAPDFFTETVRNWIEDRPLPVSLQRPTKTGAAQ